MFHGMLSFVLWELSMRPPDEVKIENIRMYQQACAANFKLGIDTNEVGAIATYENTLALCMGVSLPFLLHLYRLFYDAKFPSTSF